MFGIKIEKNNMTIRYLYHKNFFATNYTNPHELCFLNKAITLIF